MEFGTCHRCRLWTESREFLTRLQEIMSKNVGGDAKRILPSSGARVKRESRYTTTFICSKGTQQTRRRAGAPGS
jgi:hypothetical protein